MGKEKAEELKFVPSCYRPSQRIKREKEKKKILYASIYTEKRE